MKMGWKWWGAAVVTACLSMFTGCANQRASTGYESGGAYANAAPRTVIAEPGAYDGIYVEQVYAQTGDDGMVGWEQLSDGSEVTVVTYVHTYPEAIETYPSVWWSGRWYYNVNGDFVYYSADLGQWVYYYGPPAPLVACWNGYYPYSPYYWGVGYYGNGWYWGGVGVYGYHAYGLPVAHTHHHHHHHWNDRPARGNGIDDGRRPSTGGPVGDGPSPGGSTNKGPRRTQVADANPGDPRRTRPAGNPTRNEPDAPARTEPGRTKPSNGGSGTTLANNEPTRTRPSDARKDPSTGTNLAGARPTRTKPTDARKDPTGPSRTDGNGTGTLAQRRPAGTAPTTRRDPGARGPSRSNYTTASGNKVTVVNPPTRARPTRSAQTFTASKDTTFRPPPRRTSSRTPSWGQTVASPNRNAAPSRSSSPSRSAAPSRRSPSRSSTPTFSSSPSRSTAPSRSSAPSRSRAPSRTTPTRSSRTPSRSQPSRTMPSRSPSRATPSRSPSRATPSRSTPSRSRTTPSRSPTRSSPSRSPSRSAPKRSAPKRR